MDHARAEGLFDDYRAGRLDRETTRELHQHFKVCEDCRLRIRLERARVDGARNSGDQGQPASGAERQIRNNRVQLFWILALMLFAYFIWKVKR